MKTSWFSRFALAALPVVLPAAAAGAAPPPRVPAGAGPLDAVAMNAAAWVGGRPAEAACSGGQLRLGVTRGLGGMGHWSSVIEVRNAGPGSCSVRGYPAVREVTAAHGDGAEAAETPRGFSGGLPMGASSRSIVLRKGEVASALMEGTDIPIGNATTCPSYPSFTIVLPGRRNGTTFHQAIGSCSGLTVHPFVVGFNGSYPTGEVVGRTRLCTLQTNGHSPIGPSVQIDAWSGSHLAAAETLFANATTAPRYQLVLKPGEYRIDAVHDRSSRRVDVHAGLIVDLGTYGTCAPSGPFPTTTPGESSPTTTNSVTTTTTTNP